MADVTLLNFLKIMIFLKIRLDLLSLLFFRALVSKRVGWGVGGGEGRSLMGNDIGSGRRRLF